jgi:hypothetical protein
MAYQVEKYDVLIYGGPTGYQTNRAQIQLSDPAGQVRAWVRFNDPGMSFETDYEEGGIIRMHLPSHMFGPVIDLLRNESGVSIYMAAGRASLGSATEPVGEGE